MPMDWKKDHWSEEIYQNLKNYLLQIAEEEYRKFNEKIVPCSHPILGIRMPVLRKLAKEIVKGNWISYLKASKDDSHEEIMLQGMVIASASPRIPFSEVLRYITYYVPKLSNWALVDTFCGDMKIVEEYQEEAYFFIVHYLKSAEEYSVRFAIIMLMHYYLDPQHIKAVFGLFDSADHEGYYVKMALAWAISLAFVKMREETLQYLQHNHLDNWTYQKALQKILESNRVDKETKEMIRQMKQQRSYE